MNIDRAFEILSNLYDVEPGQLKTYADEDQIGGYHTSENKRKWTIGSLWEVEGKILYALVRALKPSYVLEVGSFYGASTAHIAEALIKNKKGQMTCVDNNFRNELPERYTDLITRVQDDVMNYTLPTRPKFDFVFEDAMHSTEQVEHIWEQFAKKGAKGGTIISHDAGHWIVGEQVRAGIEAVTDVYTLLEVSPSDCGLAVWKK